MFFKQQWNYKMFQCNKFLLTWKVPYYRIKIHKIIVYLPLYISEALSPHRNFLYGGGHSSSIQLSLFRHSLIPFSLSRAYPLYWSIPMVVYPLHPPPSNLLSYTFFTKSSYFILATYSHHHSALPRFAHSTAPQSIPSVVQPISNLPWMSSLLSLSHHDTP